MQYKPGPWRHRARKNNPGDGRLKGFVKPLKFMLNVPFRRTDLSTFAALISATMQFRNTYFLLLMALGALSTACSNADNTGMENGAAGTDGPLLVVEEDVFDYGEIAEGSDGTHFFEVANKGGQPLIISECQKTCGCTVPECDASPIPPGGTTKIKVTYDTKRTGPFNKTVKVISNSADTSLKTLRIKGTVIAAGS
jgi:hypothetical protein